MQLCGSRAMRGSEVAPSLDEPGLSLMGILGNIGNTVIIMMVAIMCRCSTFLISKSHNNPIIKVV